MARILALVALLVACGSPETPKSSLRPCDFAQPCGAGELCDVSQACGPPVADGGVACQPAEGDHLCHRDCNETKECAEGEICTKVTLFDRSDEAVPTWMCR